MKIAMIGQKGIPCTGGGVERHVEGLSAWLVKRGYDVTVYTRPHYTNPTLTSFGEVTLKSLPSIHTKHLDAISHSFLCTLHALWHGYDVIHYHGIGPALCAWIPRLLPLRTKVVGTFHSMDWKHGKWGTFAQWCLRLGATIMSKAPHATIAVSKSIQTYLKHAARCNARYIPSGVNPAERISRHRHNHTLQRFNLDNNPYILVVSRFVRCKAVHDAIETFILLKKNLKPRSPLQRLKLALVGDGAFTDAYVRELKARARNRSDIVFTGFQKNPQIDVLYQHAKIFYLPSHLEGMPLALLEAMAWRVPIVATRIKEIKDIIAPPHEHPGGILVKPGDLHGAAHALTHVLTNRALSKRLTRHAYQNVQTNFLWNTVVKYYDDVYLALSTPAINNFHPLSEAIVK